MPGRIYKILRRSVRCVRARLHWQAFPHLCALDPCHPHIIRLPCNTSDGTHQTECSLILPLKSWSHLWQSKQRHSFVHDSNLGALRLSAVTCTWTLPQADRRASGWRLLRKIEMKGPCIINSADAEMRWLYASYVWDYW